MKTHLLPALKLTAVLLILLGFLYPLFIRGIAYLSKGSGEGVKVESQGRVVGIEQIGQKFTEDKYFWGRPSAVDYIANSSGGSNKSASNPEYRKLLQARVDTFVAHNPYVDTSNIPSELLTASGSGLDPDISPDGALVQIPRIAAVRGIDPDKIKRMVNDHTRKPFLGILGPSKVNVLELNLALDSLK